MSSQAERRRQKAEQKKRAKREAVRKSGGASRGPAQPGGRAHGSPEEAARWPVGFAHAGADWHERGAHLHAVFTRFRDDGVGAAAFFELDLAERGVVDVKVVVGVGEAQVYGEIGRRSETEPMLECDPTLVVQLVDAALRHGQSGGHTPPPGLADARMLFGDEDLGESTFEILVGADAPAPAAPEPGLLASLKRRLGLA